MIPLFKIYTHNTLPEALTPVFESGYIGQGKQVDKFERLLGKEFKNYHVLTTNSGTAAEHLALMLMDLQPGDEVLTTPLTCTATNWPLLLHGLNIKWVDVDKDTLNISIKDLARKLTPQTKLVVVVHWGGYPVELNQLKKVLDVHFVLHGHRPHVLEDCAHAFGTTHEGRPPDMRAANWRFFSFGAIKHVTCGDGGALVFPSPRFGYYSDQTVDDLYRRGQKLRWYGIDRTTNKKDARCEDDVVEYGDKLHMNDINATIGIENLKTVNERINIHRSNAIYYNQNLHTNQLTKLQQGSPNDSAYWLYSTLVQNPIKFHKHMTECGIAVSKVHVRNDIHSCVRDHRCQLPNLDEVAPRIMCIPVGWWVTEEQREYIVDCIEKGW